MIINYNGKDLKLPDFLIVGAGKSGTSSLHYYLRQHPDIFLPKRKELHFFTYIDTPKSEIPKFLTDEYEMPLTMNDYLDYFKDARTDQIRGEVCPTYLYMYDATVNNLKKVYKERYKELKVIIILRNPAERAWSSYVMHLRDGIEPIKDFRIVIEPNVIQKRLNDRWFPGFDYIEGGMYYKQVNAYIKEFPCTKVFLYEDLANEPQKLVKEIFRFLGVDHDFTPDTRIRHNISGKTTSKIANYILYLIGKENIVKSFFKSILPYDVRSAAKSIILSKILKKQEMPEDIKKNLQKEYRDDIKKLEFLIKRDLSAWLV